MDNSGEKVEDELPTDSVEVLRERLSNMKRMMADRHGNNANGQPNVEELWNRPPVRNAGIIDGTFLSFALCSALGVILSVAVYAFYSLYTAVLKKFPSKHTEL